ncbi:MAG: phage head closure protein [Hyphomonadaceae bacterium]
MALQIGTLRHRVTIQAASEAQNAIGEMVETWVEYTTVWGRVEKLSGNRLFAAAQMEEPVTGVITIRYTDGITPKMRAVVGGKTYDIRHAIDRAGRRQALEIMVSEALNG